MPDALMNLFGFARTGAATFSPCEAYRYVLTREIGDGDKGTVVFGMVNPSTATADIPDPTITRCTNFARDWGYRRLVVINLFALRSTDPKALKKHPEPIGPDNNRHILEQARAADLFVAAWGVNGGLSSRDKAVVAMLRAAGVELHALELTSGGFPRHPLYVRADRKPMPWTPAFPGRD